NVLGTGTREDGDSVTLGVKADAGLGDIIEHDGIERLALQFLTRVPQRIVGFRGKAHDDALPLAGGDLGQDIRGWLQFESDRAFAFDFLLRGPGRREIGYSSGLDHDRSAIERSHDGIAHLARRLYLHSLRGGWRFEHSGPADQYDFGAT